MDDAHLVTRSLGGDRRAYEALVCKYQNAAFGLAFSYVRNAQDAEDLVQDAFIRGYLRLETLDDPARFGSWIKAIVVNGTRQLFRQRHAVTARALNLEGAVPELERQAVEDYRQRQADRALWAEVSALPEIYRTALILHYANRLSYDEVAGFLGLPVSTVRGRLQKARGKLRTMLTEDMAMEKVDVTEAVREAICKIARREIHEEVDLGDATHVNLKFGVPTDVRVVGHSGRHVLVRGHLTAVGESPEQAATILSHIEFRHDEVDDWVEAAIPEGEKFCGTDRTSDGQVVANIQKSGGKDTSFDGDPESFGHGLMIEDVFPHMAPSRELLEQIRNAFPKRAHRVMLVNRKVTDMVLPRSALTDEVREGFSINSDWGEGAHGPVGRAVLEVAVPQGVAVTTGAGGRMVVQGLSGNMLCRHGNIEKIVDVQGDVFLLHSYVQSIANVKGNVLGFYHDRKDTGQWQDGRRPRPEPEPMALKNVRGDIELDVGSLNLKISSAGGNVKVRNRTGNTTISAPAWAEGTHWRLESQGGKITVRLSEDLIRERHISGTTLSGEFNYAVPEELLGACLKACNTKMMLFSTRPWFADRQEQVDHLNADIWMVSESGDIKVDRLPE